MITDVETIVIDPRMRDKGISICLLMQLVMRQTTRVAIRSKERIYLLSLIEALFALDPERHQ
jgi:hypothetical protein